MFTKNNWWKTLCVVLLTYLMLFGLTMPVPKLNILNETIRNVYFHVSLWFAMIALMTASGWHAVKYLRTNLPDHDLQSLEYANTGLLFGLLGYVTGALWGNYTWGDPLPKDPKVISAAIGMLIYFAYWLLRGSFEDQQRRARIAAVYNIFAFCIFMPLIFVLPRLTASLHPGNGGNPAIGSYDMSNQMRVIFYPAIIGYILLGVWITSLRIRLKRLNFRLEED